MEACAPSRCLWACRPRAGDREGGTGTEGRGQREPARSEDSTSSGQGAGRCGYEPGAGRPALPLARCVTESRCVRDFSVPARSPRAPFTGAVVPLPASQALLLSLQRLADGHLRKPGPVSGWDRGPGRDLCASQCAPRGQATPGAARSRALSSLAPAHTAKPLDSQALEDGHFLETWRRPRGPRG